MLCKARNRINNTITYQKKTSGNTVTSRSYAYLNNQIVGFTDKEGNTESKYYTVTDIQGSVTEVYDGDGSLVWKSGYTAFGIKAGETTGILDFGGLYTGCDYDVETELSYHWIRWRSEDGEFWLTQDPARDGINWYGYAGQNPINFVDSNGLFYYGKDGQHSSLNPDNIQNQLEKQNEENENQNQNGRSTEDITNHSVQSDTSAKPNDLKNKNNNSVTLIKVSYKGKYVYYVFIINGREANVRTTLKKQAELEKKYGYDNILCYVTSLLNMYISDGVVSNEFIDNRLGKIISNHLNNKKEIKDFNNFSMDLAKELGLNEYYAYVYDQTKAGKQVIFDSKKEFYGSKYKYAIGRYSKKGEKWSDICEKHYELFRNSLWNDIVNPGKDNDEGPYDLHDIWPTQLCPIKRKEK